MRRVHFSKQSPRRIAAALMAPIFSFFLLGAAPTSLPKQSRLPLDLAVKVAGAALKKCLEDGYRVSVAVVDREGVTQSLLRADGAGPHTIQSSTKKAYTAASLGRPTSDLANTLKDKPELQGLRDMDEKILILAGGLPIVVEGELVGGIGVGGAPGGHLDEACAKAGLETFSEK
ncbi:MAG: heme-binding protein [Nitrospirae bacterium]|nr:heme-binding protein [Candidatus Manganitrophaceae bacterium]